LTIFQTAKYEFLAGGEKYLVNNIFFKFALDIYHLYGGTEFAMKAGTCQFVEDVT